jgi:hypothetical protein
LTLYAIWGYQYKITYKADQYCVDSNAIYVDYVRSSTQIAQYTLLSCPFKQQTGYRCKNYIFGAQAGIGSNQAVGTTMSISANMYAVVNSTNKYWITYKHTNNTSWYAASGTGRMECYELRVNGVAKGKLGAFSNGPTEFTATYGDTIEVACTYALDSNYVESVASIKVNGTTVANTSGAAAYGYYPYSSSDSLRIPNGDKKEVAYARLVVNEDMTINFIAQTNLSLI